jgi:hypothetical protein
MEMSTLWDVEPCIAVEVDLSFGGAYCLHYQGDDGGSMTLMMKAVSTYETSFNFSRSHAVTSHLYLALSMNRIYLLVFCDLQNKQRLFFYTALTN